MGLLEEGQGEVRDGVGLSGPQGPCEGALTGSGEGWEGSGGGAECRAGLACGVAWVPPDDSQGVSD